jgi:hypothetical protein
MSGAPVTRLAGCSVIGYLLNVEGTAKGSIRTKQLESMELC